MELLAETDVSIPHQMSQLVIQIAIMIIVAWWSDMITKKIGLPQVIGYIIMGLFIGPYLLGSIPVGTIFPHGIFPLMKGTVSVSINIHGLATIASMILLFFSGLETDVTLFLRYSIKGSVVGLGGLIFSFIGGYLVSLFFFPAFHSFHPAHLFTATIATATSVGITSTVLSRRRKISSPEGVTILSAAVLDDVISIIFLAIIVSITDVLQSSTHVQFTSSQLMTILLLSTKAIGLWLGCTIMGIIFAKKFGKGLKYALKDPRHIAIISLGCALLLGGIFELFGLSMIIGAYIVGLTLSNTDLSYVIQEKLAPISALFVPIFFIVSGMSINLHEILQHDVLLLGLVLGIVCILTKFIGGGVPALFLGFNTIGAARIGLGMVPRGEVALIIAGLGLGLGILSEKMFGAILMMIVLSSVVAPFILDRLLKHPKSGRNKIDPDQHERTEFDLKHEQLTQVILGKVLNLLEQEEFFINSVKHTKYITFHVRKDDIFIMINMNSEGKKLVFLSDKNTIPLIKTTMYESIASIAETTEALRSNIDTKSIINKEVETHKMNNLSRYLSPTLIKPKLKSNSKDTILQELTDVLYQSKIFSEETKKLFLGGLYERENTLSTGLQDGIAIPHATSKYITNTHIVIGLKPGGIDFNALDGKPSKIFILIASPKNSPHLAILTYISTALNKLEFREKLLALTTADEIYRLFTYEQK